MNEGIAQVAERAPTPTELADNEPPAPGHSPPPEPVPTPTNTPVHADEVFVAATLPPRNYTGPEVDPWAVLRKELSPVALAALEQVTGKKDAAPGTAPWYECWDVVEGRPTGHPPFQGFVKPGQHVYCPFVDERTGACGRKTVRPLENYVPV